MSFEIVPFSNGSADRWDDIVAKSANGTFLHSRRFLSYHGSRFEDLSVMVSLKGEFVAAFPAARSPADNGTVVSHPGLTYGGIVHNGGISGDRMLDVLDCLSRHYRDLGMKRLLYKVVPYIYSIAPSQDDIYALWRFGATRVRCDLAVAIDLGHRLRLSQRRERGLRKAMRSVVVRRNVGAFDDFWFLLTENLTRKHEATPVHNLEDVFLLVQRFPENIELYGAFVDDVLVAGVLLFKMPRVWHAQYIASSEQGYDLSALDVVFDEIIRDTKAAGVRYFDFGTCNENGGLILNAGLYRFKAEFGGAGVAYEQYELGLGDR